MDNLVGAVDIGGTKIAVGLVTFQGKVLTHRYFPTNAQQGPQPAILRIKQSLSELSADLNVQLSGIGIGSTGPVDPFTGRFGLVEFLPGWENFNLVDAVSNACGVSAAVENDADAYALGEWQWGSGKNNNPFMVVTIGTGIGVSLIQDGRIYRGVDGAHPEIGHHVIDPSGPPCFCGANGCWESLASGPAMEQWAAQQSPLLPHRSGKDLCQAALLGDQSAQAAVKRTSHYLGLGMANLVTLFAPQTLALSGGMMSVSQLFLPTILETIESMCGYVPKHKTRIIVLESDAMAGLRGAAQVWVASQTQPKEGIV